MAVESTKEGEETRKGGREGGREGGEATYLTHRCKRGSQTRPLDIWRTDVGVLTTPPGEGGREGGSGSE
jgi:hypothetical protein